MTRTFRLLAVCISLLACLLQFAQCEPVVKPGDRVVFLGDSITEQRLYTRYVMDYFALHYPSANITFRNAGWSGDTATGGLNRLQRDVLSLKPNVVTICFGMNDAAYSTFNQERFDQYMKSMSGLVSELKKAGVRVVLLTPGCVDADRTPYFQSTYNDTLDRFANGVIELARDERLPVYNIHRLMLDVQQKAKAADKSFTMIPDGVHPSEAGQALMAYGLLNAIGCNTPASGLEIDAAKSTAIPDRCTVSRLKVSADAVRFVRTDESLPQFFHPAVEGIVRFAPFIMDPSAYKFKVTGLKAGTWKLTVQGMDVGNFSAESLAAGVDLANCPGPWKKLASEFDASSADQENAYFIIWRTDWQVYPASTKGKMESLKKALDKAILLQESTRTKDIAKRSWDWSLVHE